MKSKSLLLFSFVYFAASVICHAQNRANNFEKKMAEYLMVYFKDESHSLYFATSKDGYSFSDVNDGKPVIAGSSIAEQKGIRDPYLYRAPDGTFYMAMTDLHIFAQRDGYRDTEWERDRKSYGWGNNRGFVMMKSRDLVHWEHWGIRVDKSFAGLDEIGCAWAPEMIYDADKKQTMIYFTMRYNNGPNKIFYSYLSDGFRKLATKPKQMFEYPKNDKSFIDADITKVGDSFHMLYVPHDGTPGIKQAVSAKLDTGYVYDDKWIDPESKACEAPNVYKLIGQNKWILVYDIYGITPQNFGFSETSDFKTFNNLGHFNEGKMKATNFSIPKHPSVIQISKKEANVLRKFWRKK